MEQQQQPPPPLFAHHHHHHHHQQQQSAQMNNDTNDSSAMADDDGESALVSLARSIVSPTESSTETATRITSRPTSFQDIGRVDFGAPTDYMLSPAMISFASFDTPNFDFTKFIDDDIPLLVSVKGKKTHNTKQTNKQTTAFAFFCTLLIHSLFLFSFLYNFVCLLQKRDGKAMCFKSIWSTT